MKDDLEKRMATMKKIKMPRKVEEDPMKTMAAHLSKISLKENMMKFPEFHLEYSKKYKNEKEHIEKLSKLYKEFQMNSVITSSPASAARSLELEGETEAVLVHRWGPNLMDPKFQQFDKGFTIKSSSVDGGFRWDCLYLVSY